MKGFYVVLLLAVPAMVGAISLQAAVSTGSDNPRTPMHKLPPGRKVPAYRPGEFDPRGTAGKRNVFACVAVVLLGIFFLWLNAEINHPKNPDDGLKREHKDIEQDTYGFALASLIRDMQQIDAHSSSGPAVVGRPPTVTDDGVRIHPHDMQQIDYGRSDNLRRTRMVFACGLLAFTIGLQMFIMYYLKILVVAKWVTDIRDDYSDYELHMYGEANTIINLNGKHRGIPGHFQPGNFGSLDDGLKERVCNIAFSQPFFFASVLLIWTLTIIAEIRKILALFRSLIINTRNISYMKDALTDLDPNVADDDPDNAWVIDGLTIPLKVLITVFVLLPRLILTSVLLWLGSRFLAATNDFGSMVLNAVALEFVLLLKDLLYHTIVPDRNKREVENIKERPSQMIQYATWWSYLGTFSWFLVGIAWIIFYVFHFQMVLPAYRWDVKPICTSYLAVRYNDAPTSPPPSAL